jgi:putative oxidoreductase
MIVAYITADREALFSIISNPDKFTAAAPYTFLVASLLVLILGPGRFSLDAPVTRRRDKRRIRRTLTETSGSAAVA